MTQKSNTKNQNTSNLEFRKIELMYQLEMTFVKAKTREYNFVGSLKTKSNWHIEVNIFDDAFYVQGGDAARLSVNKPLLELIDLLRNEATGTAQEEPKKGIFKVCKGTYGSNEHECFWFQYISPDGEKDNPTYMLTWELEWRAFYQYLQPMILAEDVNVIFTEKL